MKGKESEVAHGQSSVLWKKHVELFDEIVHHYRNREGIFVDGGCGREQFLQRYEDNFKYCIGFDVELDTSRHNTDSVFYSHGHLEHIPLKDGSVDVFLTNYVLEHIENPQNFFEEIGRVVKPKGVFVSWTPNAHSPFGFVLKMLPISVSRALKRLLLKDCDYFPTYYKVNTVSRLDSMLKSVGFIQVDFEMIDGVFPYSKSKAVRCLHSVFVRLSRYGRLRYIKDIIFAVYIKKDHTISQNNYIELHPTDMCGRKT